MRPSSQFARAHCPRRFAAALLGVSLAGAPALAPGAAGAAEPAAEFFAAEHVERAFPGAERVGPVADTPPAAPAFRGGELAGYLFSTRQVTGSTGFSGKPLDIVVGIGTDGRITGASLREQHEPILVIGVSPADLEAFVAQYRGVDLRASVRLAGTRAGRGAPAGTGAEAAPEPVRLDGISGASITTVVMNDAILRSARIVARSRGLLPPAPGAAGAGPRVDMHGFEPAGWDRLVSEGAVAHLRLSVGEARARFAEAGGGTGEEEDEEGHEEDEDEARGFAPDPAATLVDLYAALATPAGIGRNLLGDLGYNRVMRELGPGDQAVLIAGGGLYSFKGTAYVRTGTFERIQIVQGARTIRLSREGHTRLDEVAAEGAPDFREIGLFVVPASAGLDPARDWRLELLVDADTVGAGPGAPEFATFAVEYALPERFLLAPAGDEAGAGEGAAPALWQEVWADQPVKIAILSLALAVLTAALIFQDQLVQRPRFYRWFRIGFLGFTLVWIGWYAGAQLSVLNVITFVQSLVTEFRWDFFLLGPLIFILWSFVAVGLLFWGRGVFCGWLCPFGALQELLNNLAQALRIPQLRLPFRLNERLWMVKYVIFLALLGVSFYSVPLAVVGAEVEPFKTAITLKFVREWPFVAFAVGVLAAGLFIERFYCRYLCPLGAALAIPARGRMFEWLKRHPQCGRECHICARHCMVQAIHPDGHINLNECVYCLECQVLYYDDHVCPPLIARRKRREARQELRDSAARRKAERAAGGAQTTGERR